MTLPSFIALKQRSNSSRFHSLQGNESVDIFPQIVSASWKSGMVFQWNVLRAHLGAGLPSQADFISIGGAGGANRVGGANGGMGIVAVPSVGGLFRSVFSSFVASLDGVVAAAFETNNT